MTSTARRPRASQLVRAAVASVAMGHALAGSGCAPPPQRKPLEMAPIGTFPTVKVKEESDSGSSTTAPNSGTPVGKDGTCTGGDFESLEEILSQCGSPMPRTGDVPGGMREKLEVRVTSSTPSTSPGGRVDITVTMRNKGSEPLPLFFSGDPAPHFEVEALDPKGRRVDMPTGKPPKTPFMPTREVKASRITLTPGGTARVRIAWDAVKTRWAPEKVKTWEGRGYARAPAGNLPNGKYTLRTVLPLLGVFEKGDLDIPKLPIEVAAGS